MRTADLKAFYERQYQGLDSNKFIFAFTGINGRHVVTDGFHLASHIGDADWTEEKDDAPDRRKIEKLVESMPVDGWERLVRPDFELPRPALGECELCHGEGERLCDLSYRHHCSYCDGEGERIAWPDAKYGRLKLDWPGVNLVTVETALKFFPQVVEATVSENQKAQSAIWFRSGDSFALVMEVLLRDGEHTDFPPWEPAEKRS